MIGTTLGAMDRFSLCTYDGTEIGSTDGNVDGKFEFLLLSASLGYLDVIEVSCTEGTKLWIYDRIVIGKYI